jgi:hypothetical protein
MRTPPMQALGSGRWWRTSEDEASSTPLAWFNHEVGASRIAADPIPAPLEIK